jgi:hypothetical protein
LRNKCERLFCNFCKSVDNFFHLTHPRSYISNPLLPTFMVCRWTTFTLPLTAGWVSYTVIAGQGFLIEAVCKSNLLNTIYMSAVLLYGCTRLGRQSPWRLNSLRWCLLSLGPQYKCCFVRHTSPVLTHRNLGWCFDFWKICVILLDYGGLKTEFTIIQFHLKF